MESFRGVTQSQHFESRNAKDSDVLMGSVLQDGLLASSPATVSPLIEQLQEECSRCV